MAAQPLTHHEILGLVEPFARCGRHLDLAASNRLERRLAFRPIEHAGLRETLRLENPWSGTYRLTRTLTLANGVAATLEAEGPQPRHLLELVESIPPRRQFHSGAGFVLARSYCLAGREPMILSCGLAQVAGLTLVLTAPTVRGMAADLALLAATGDPIELPEDLFAVLGWGWALLNRTGEGWRSSVRVPGTEPGRTRAAEGRLEQATLHLAATLGEPPARFHERWVAARWAVTGRRALPLLVCALLIGAALGVSRLHIAQDSPLRMLMFNAPPVLLMLVFCLREVPRFEIPRMPRRPRAEQWRAPPPPDPRR